MIVMSEEHCSVAIIGGGPHALTLVLRVLDRLSHGNAGSGDITEAEFYRRSFCLRGTHCGNPECPSEGAAVLKRAGVRVFDASGGWMKRWRDQFDALDIHHLRSPCRVHPWSFVDPFALVAFAVSEQRQDEILHNNDIVDRLQSSERGKKKKKRGNNPELFNENIRSTLMYGLPTQTLFQDFCDQLIVPTTNDYY